MVKLNLNWFKLLRKRASERKLVDEAAVTEVGRITMERVAREKKEESLATAAEAEMARIGNEEAEPKRVAEEEASPAATSMEAKRVRSTAQLNDGS